MDENTDIKERGIIIVGSPQCGRIAAMHIETQVDEDFEDRNQTKDSIDSILFFSNVKIEPEYYDDGAYDEKQDIINNMKSMSRMHQAPQSAHQPWSKQRTKSKNTKRFKSKRK